MTGIDVRKLVQVRNFGRVHYRLGTVLGKGGFAKVYQAEQSFTSRGGIDINRVVAVKIVPKARVTRADQVNRVKCEMAIQSKISHPNILRMVTHWEDQDKYCMALEFCQQKTLLSYVRQFENKIVPEKEAVDIMKQLMSAVTYLHENDIIHRDIKLGNILRHEDVVKLGDFGLACNYRTDDVKQLCGTPNFLPPEVFKYRYHSTASDIWAAGCVLYTLLAGENPFKYTGMEETKRTVCAMEYTIPTFLSTQAVEVIKFMLNGNHTERPSARQIMTSELFYKYGDDSQTRKIIRTKSNPTQARRSLYFQSPSRATPSTASPRRPLHDCNANSEVSPSFVNVRPLRQITSRRRLVEEMSQPTSRKRSAMTAEESLPKIKQSKEQSNCVFVTKWLDYYNKIGFGYTLSDGTTAIMMKNGSTVLGTEPDNVELMSGRECRSVIDGGPDSSYWRRWNQFHTYMRDNLLPGVEQTEVVPRDKLVCVKHFIRNERAVCFELSNGVRQINFMDGDRQKFIIKDDGIIQVESRKQKSFTWDELNDAIDEAMLERLTYAMGKFDWIKQEHLKEGNNNEHDDALAAFIEKFQH